MKRKTTVAIMLAAALCTGHALAQNVVAKDAWARATVQGQKASGAFMTLTAKADTTLVSVASSVAGVAEVHEMKMDGGVMQMRALPKGLELPAGKAVTLKPGSFHLMLMDLKVPLQKDTTIPLALRFKDAKGVESTLDMKVPVASTAPGVPTGGSGAHPHGMHHAPAKP
ncbi:MAG: copper chaperone PCu(A)C [Rhodoferax sp.]|nr:copper chaperone PCu(A)C [Rhodoferax sp.]